MSITKNRDMFFTIKGSIIMVYMLIASTYVNSFQIHEVKKNRTKGRNGQVHSHGYIHTLRWKWKHLIFYLIQISLFWSLFFIFCCHFTVPFSVFLPTHNFRKGISTFSPLIYLYFFRPYLLLSLFLKRYICYR